MINYTFDWFPALNIKVLFNKLALKCCERLLPFCWLQPTLLTTNNVRNMITQLIDSDYDWLKRGTGGPTRMGQDLTIDRFEFISRSSIILPLDCRLDKSEFSLKRCWHLLWNSFERFLALFLSWEIFEKQMRLEQKFELHLMSLMSMWNNWHTEKI